MAQFNHAKRKKGNWASAKSSPWIILGSDYDKHPAALEITGLRTLDDHQKGLYEQFAKNSKMYQLFPLNKSSKNTRNPEKYFVTGAIPHMQRFLNEK